ncbi:unnamed protein product [Paramecium primaurelia]|uniref:Uncharacterized protein n=1 Tax=Paramecium primaurelia TaxID=5886 RepID=A0A8S1PNF3_PARPR|nr:unnamed protein product [Paramecium primaurelia]
MKSSNEKEKICDIYFFKSALSIEKLGRNPLEKFSQIQIDDVLVSTNENIFYLKCQVQLQQMKRYVLVGFKIGKSIYKSLIFILLRNINSEFQAISKLLIKLNKNQLMPLIYLQDSQICLLNENDEIIKDFESLNEKEIDLVDGDNKPSIIDNSDNEKNDQDKQDNNDDQSDDNTLDLDTSNFQIGSFLVMSTIEEALIYSLFKTFGRRRIEPIDVV